MPVGAPSFSEGLRWGVEIFHALKTLKKKGFSTNVGDEGGFAPISRANEEAIETVLEAITAAGSKQAHKSPSPWTLPTASSGMPKRKNTFFHKAAAKEMSSGSGEFWEKWVKQYPSRRLKTACEDDWAGWKLLTETWATNASW